MNVTFSTRRLAALQSETDAYNKANNTTLTVDQFVQLVMDDRAEAWIRQSERAPTKDEYEALKAERDALVASTATGVPAVK